MTRTVPILRRDIGTWRFRLLAAPRRRRFSRTRLAVRAGMSATVSMRPSLISSNDRLVDFVLRVARRFDQDREPVHRDLGAAADRAVGSAITA